MNNSTESNMTNNRGSPPKHLTEMEWIFAFFFTHGLLAFFTIVANFVVLYVFIKNARLRTATNVVLMSMAFADLLVGLLVVPIWMFVSYRVYEIGSPYPEGLFKFFDAFVKMDQALVFVTVYHLVYLHSLRSYSIVFPLRHRQMSSRPVILAIFIIWALSIAFPPVVRILIIADSCRFCYVYVSLAFNIGLPLLIISAANIVLYRTVVKSSRQHQNKDNKILVTIGLLIGLLAVCYFPFLIVNIINVFSKKLKITVGTVFTVKFIHFLNSAVNPVVYALRNRDLGRAIKTMVCGKQQRDVTSTARTLASGNPSRSVIITTT